MYLQRISIMPMYWTKSDAVLEDILADSACLWRRSLILFRTPDHHMSSTYTVPSTSFSYTTRSSSRPRVPVISSDISGGIVASSALSFALSGWIGRGALKTSVSIIALKAASTMKCAQTARAMAFPISICTTALGAYINSRSSCSPAEAITCPIQPMKLISAWKPPNVERFVSDHSLKARSGWSKVMVGRHHGVVHAQ